MVCEVNDTFKEISIPAVMLPQDVGATFRDNIIRNLNGKTYLVGKFDLNFQLVEKKLYW